MPAFLVGALYGIAVSVLALVIWQGASEADRRHAELEKRRRHEW